MLYNFAVHHLEFYVSVRAELSRWILHRSDPYLSSKAEEYFNKLALVFESQIEGQNKPIPLEEWKSRISFEYGVPDHEKQRILTSSNPLHFSRRASSLHLMKRMLT